MGLHRSHFAAAAVLSLSCVRRVCWHRKYTDKKHSAGITRQHCASVSPGSPHPCSALRLDRTSHVHAPSPFCLRAHSSPLLPPACAHAWLCSVLPTCAYFICFLPLPYTAPTQAHITDNGGCSVFHLTLEHRATRPQPEPPSGSPTRAPPSEEGRRFSFLLVFSGFLWFSSGFLRVFFCFLRVFL